MTDQNLPATTAGNGGQVALIPQSDYMVLCSTPTEIREVIAENIGGDSINLGDLDRVKIPSGGGKFWEIPDIDAEGGVISARELEGIIIYKKKSRVWFENPEPQEGAQPDCFSDDNEHGVCASAELKAGGIGGLCADCPLSQFGSDPKGGGGQACKQMEQLFIVRKNSYLPLMLNLPPTSLKPMKKFLLRLASSGIPYSSVIVKMTLAEASNDSGQKYSVVEPVMVRRLTDQERPIVQALAETLRPALNRVRLEPRDAQESGTEEAPVVEGA